MVCASSSCLIASPLRRKVGVVFQALDEEGGKFVEAQTQRVVRVGSHLADKTHHASDRFLGGVSAGDVAQADEAQVLDLGGDDLGDLRLDGLVVERVRELLQHAVELLLVPLFSGQDVEQLASKPRNVDLFKAGDDRRPEEAAPFIIEYAKHRRWCMDAPAAR